MKQVTPESNTIDITNPEEWVKWVNKHGSVEYRILTTGKREWVATLGAPTSFIMELDWFGHKFVDSETLMLKKHMTSPDGTFEANLIYLPNL